MRILGIDTATSNASAAVLENEAIIADEVRVQPKVGHAEIILPLVQSVFAKARIALSDLDGIAVSIGPGSFTGLRVGLSTVKGLVYGAQRLPVAGISTLLAQAARTAPLDGLICSMLDARKKEVYASFFRRTSGSLTRLTEDIIEPIEAVVEQARNLANDGSILFTGDGARVYWNALVSSLGAGICFCDGEDYPSLASAVARLGEHRLRHSEGDFLGPMVPVYLRLSEAETKRVELS
jgi:tRNA threonylcarbamoyladenosine biosynthesis protein TsaB